MMRLKALQVFEYGLFLIVMVGLVGCDTGAVNDPVPDVPNLVFPSNGDSEGPNATELHWNPSENASLYHLQLGTDASFGQNMVDDSKVSASTYPLSGLELDKTYYWRVRAMNDHGAGDWSQSWSFSPGKEAEIPEIPTLVFPGVSAVNLPTQIDFSWDPVEGATSYRVQVSMEPNFRRRIADIEGVRETFATVRELVPTYTYFWRVSSQNPLGSSEWSQMRRLVVEDDDVEQRDYN